MLQKFYFVFGLYDNNTRYKSGWITVLAKNKEQACDFMKNEHPDFYNQKHFKNYIYDEKSFKKTSMYTAYNHLGQNCHKTYNAETGEELPQPKLNIYNLCVEVTRKCNMNCQHCMRGESQSIDMNFDTIRPILAHTESISTLTFTGGEPTLNIDIMEKVLSYVKMHNIQVYSFYIVTNGKEIPDEFLLLLHKWYNYTIECGGDAYQDYNGVCLSKDIFHEPISKENDTILKSFSFYKEDKITDWDKHLIIQDGRAHDLPKSFSFIEAREQEDVSVNINEEHYDIDEDLYISAKGEITANCDYSYENMEKYAVGNTNDIDAFFEYLNATADIYDNLPDYMS